MTKVSIPLLLALLALGGALVGWNISRFLDAKAVIRMDPHLEFLPEPEVAAALALGHRNTVAKLRWIDGFSHLSYQMDHAATSGSTDGLKRYYRTLIALDPRFPSYYEHAATVLGGLKGDLHAELAFGALGLHHNPTSTRLWAAFVAALSAHYRLEERFPEQMEDILQRWGEIERAKERGAEHFPGDWLAALARRHNRGLEQMTYWGRLLLVSEEGSPQLVIARRTMREQLARYGLDQLQALVASYQARTGAPPVELAQVLGEDDLRAHYAGPDAATQPAEPITAVDGGFELRPDPYGYAYELVEGEVVSPGLATAKWDKRLAWCNQSIRDQAIKRRRWPETLAEATEWGGSLPPVPGGASLELRDGLLVRVEPAGLEPWSDAALLAAAGLNPEAARDD